MYFSLSFFRNERIISGVFPFFVVQCTNEPLSILQEVCYFSLAYAGAAIAKARPMKTAITATKLAIGAFIVPYAFAMSPSMLLIDTNVLEVILISVTSFIGICSISAAMEGYLMVSMPWYQRLLSLVGGLMLVFPGVATDVGGITLAAAVVALQFLARRKSLVQT